MAAIELIQADITQLDVDAIVNAAKSGQGYPVFEKIQKCFP